MPARFEEQADTGRLSRSDELDKGRQVADQATVLGGVKRFRTDLGLRAILEMFMRWKK